MMKTGRNDPCPCGSGAKYKRCCMDAISKQQARVLDEVEQMLAMSPDLTLEDINLVLQQKMVDHNNTPVAELGGLSPAQMSNWLYAPMSELKGVEISAPEDCSQCPTLRYLELIFEEAIAQGGSFKSTAKGNLPAQLVLKANGVLAELPASTMDSLILRYKFSGKKEEAFMALHYTRVLAQAAGILYHRAGRFHLKKEMLKKYQAQGIRAFFLPMLETAVSKYNWAYLDSFEGDIDLRMFWLFMLWRLGSHGSVQKLVAEMQTAFPTLLDQLPQDSYLSPPGLLEAIIEARFADGFLQYWGLMLVDPRRFLQDSVQDRRAHPQPLLAQTFRFLV